MSRFTSFQGIPNSEVAHQGPLTISNTAVTLTSLLSGGALHANTQFVGVRFETQPVRMTVNGTTPTTTLGIPYGITDEILLSRAEAEAAKLIRSTGSDGGIQVWQYVA